MEVARFINSADAATKLADTILHLQF